MALLQNNFLQNQLPVKWRQGGAIGMSRHCYGQGGELMNQATAFGPLAATPSGCYAPTAWILPVRAGAMAARNRLAGTGALTPGALIEGRALISALAGSGDVTGAGQLIISMVASLTGTGEVTGAVQGFLQLAASLAGAGDIAGALTAIAHAEAALTGDAELAATLSALGSLAAALNVTGATLTTANVGDAVWAKTIESGYSAEEIIRLLTAALAGKSSGAGTGTMQFRDLADTKARLTGTLDSNGNRTTVTLDPS